MFSHFLAVRLTAILLAMMPGPMTIAAAAAEMPAITPAGVTLQYASRRSRGSESQRVFFDRYSGDVYFGDAEGLAYYTFSNDTHGVSSCVGDCTKSWIPATPTLAAKATGHWSVIQRTDGKQQWAYRGKPVYRYASDSKIGETAGDGAEDKKWNLLRFAPSEELTGPDGITFEQSIDVDGIVLVNKRKYTLYEYIGDLKAVGNTCAGAACKDLFHPISAPALARAHGAFAPITRPDGVTQWAYNGKLLFSYEGDLYAGAARGEAADPRWRPVVQSVHYRPSGLQLTQTPNLGPHWVTQQGMTIYRRETLVHIAADRNSFRPELESAAVGRDIGTRGCVDECLKQFLPVVASPDASPGGLWSIYRLSDGTRQWAYKGYALYTYVGDKAPGDMTANDQLEWAIDDRSGRYEKVRQISALVNIPGVPAFYWRYAEP